MSRSGASFRPLGGLALLVVQLATASAWAVLEARAVSSSPTAHVEQAGGRECPPPHDETLCRLCQMNGHRLLPGGPRLTVTAAPARSVPMGAAPDGRLARPVPTTGAPRAPPRSV